MEKFVKILGTVIVLALSGMFVIRCVSRGGQVCFLFPRSYAELVRGVLRR